MVSIFNTNNFQKRSIQFIDSLTGFTSPGQNGLENNINERVTPYHHMKFIVIPRICKGFSQCILSVTDRDPAWYSNNLKKLLEMRMKIHIIKWQGEFMQSEYIYIYIYIYIYST